MCADRTSTPTHDRGEERAPTFGFLSTFPPTACGLATFTAALAAGLAVHGAETRVVRIGDGSRTTSELVVAELTNGSKPSLAASAELLNQTDVAVIQHEYGIYGGPDGDEVLEILGDLSVPSIVIAHTILTSPTSHQRDVLVDVASLADQVVVMSDAARLRLCNNFDVDPGKVVTIPHGAALPAAAIGPLRCDRPTLLTWGLIGPGKGIERVIDAMRSLHRLAARPRYLVAGQTHPKVLASNGEEYRRARIEQAFRNGVASSVTFDASYRDVPSLTALIQSAAAVVLPYDTDDQVTSGVLVDAIAAGRLVVATAFPHAIELLGSGAGIVVDHDDPEALEKALHRVLTDADLAASMTSEARRLAPTMGWPVVARSYIGLAKQLLVDGPVLV